MRMRMKRKDMIMGALARFFYILLTEYKMVSNAPNSQSLNYTHMWNQTDLRGPLPKSKACGNTLLSALDENSDFSFFRKIVAKAKMEDILNSSQANITLFVPSNLLMSEKMKDIDSIDTLKARQIIRASSLENKISSEIFAGCQSLSLVTCDPSNRLLITSDNKSTFINGEIKLVEYDLISENGIIHTIDRPIIPYSQM